MAGEGKLSQWIWLATGWMRGALSCGQSDRSSLAHTCGSNRSGVSLPAQAIHSLLPEAFMDHCPSQPSPLMRANVDLSIHPSSSFHPNFHPSNYLSFLLSLSFLPPLFSAFSPFYLFSFFSPSFVSPFPLFIHSVKLGIQRLPSAPPPGSIGKMRSFYRTRGLAEVRPLTVDSTPALVLTGDPARLSAAGPDLSTEDTDESEPDSGLQELTTRRERERETDPEIAPGQGRWEL